MTTNNTDSRKITAAMKSLLLEINSKTPMDHRKTWISYAIYAINSSYSKYSRRGKGEGGDQLPQALIKAATCSNSVGPFDTKHFFSANDRFLDKLSLMEKNL